jgi:hypothetical protein
MKTFRVSVVLLATLWCGEILAQTLSPPPSADGPGPTSPTETLPPAGERPTPDAGTPPKRGWPQRPPASDEKPGPIGGTPPIYSRPQTP